MSFLVYTKRGCPWCEDLMVFLNGKNIPFEEREVRGDKKYFDEMFALSKQAFAPTVVLGGEVFADTDKNEIENVLISINARFQQA